MSSKKSTLTHTHTIRWSGDKSHRIITFTPKTMKMFKTAKHDMVIRVVLDVLLTKAKELTGNNHSIDHEQYNELTEFVKTIEFNTGNKYHYFAETWMIAGIKTMSKNLVDLFEYLNVIFPVMHNAMKDLPNE